MRLLPIALGATAVCLLASKVCLAKRVDELKAKVAALVRDNFFFTSIDDRFTPEEIEEANYIETGYAGSIGFVCYHDYVTITHKTNGLVIEILRFESTGASSFSKIHNCLCIGGRDEDLRVAPIRLKPYLEECFVQSNSSLRLMQISFYNIKFEQNACRPLSAEEYGEVTFLVLNQLQQVGRKVHTLICRSMGSIVLHNLEKRDLELVPKNLILDRTIPSIKKLARQVFPWLHPIIFRVVLWSFGAPDPENSLLSFFNECSGKLRDRRLLLIEAHQDEYVPPPYGWDAKFIENLTARGTLAAYYRFKPNRIHVHARAHHACSLAEGVNWTGNKISCAPWLEIAPQEGIIRAIVSLILCAA